jgi:hypothetical protein
MPVDEKEPKENFPHAVMAEGGRKIKVDRGAYEPVTNDILWRLWDWDKHPICKGPAQVCNLEDYDAWGKSYRNFIESKLKAKYNKTKEQLEKGFALQNKDLEAILKEIEDYLENQYNPVIKKYEDFEKDKGDFEAAAFFDYAAPPAILAGGAAALFFKSPAYGKFLISTYKKFGTAAAASGLFTWGAYEFIDDRVPSIDWGQQVENIVIAFQRGATLLDRFNEVDIEENAPTGITVPPTKEEVASKKSGENTNIYLGLAVGSVIALGTLYYMNKN